MFPRFTVALLVALALVLPAIASERTALVIANSDYGTHQAKTGDTRPLVGDLESLGFAVTTAENLPGNKIRETISNYIKATPTNGTSVLYFTGFCQSYRSGKDRLLTLALQGSGYTKDHKSAQKASAPLPEILRWIESDSGAERHLIILEPSPENPFLQDSTVSSEKDLAEFDIPETTQISFSSKDAVAALRSSLPDSPPTYLASDTPKTGSHPGQRWVNGSGMIFTWCPPGSFKMGFEGEPDATPVDVTLSRGFWIATYELTQREYKFIRGRDVPREVLFHHRNAPVTHIGNGSSSYAKKLTEIERKAGRLSNEWEYRVPTEAEWEYACRAGTKTAFNFGDSPSALHRHANFADASLHKDNPEFYYADTAQVDTVGESLAPVGSYKPNPWGIHDMHGNVSEWCRDFYFLELPGGKDPYPDEDKNDGTRVVRGGAWCSTADYCRSGFRSSYSISNNAEKVNWLGVRFVLKRVK